MAHRQTLSDGSVRLQGAHCAFEYRRPRAGALLVRITGDDDGELGSAPRDEIDQEIARYPEVVLYVDAREVSGVATAVSDAWTAWFRTQRSLRRAHVLVGSRFVHIAVAAAKVLSGTGERMQVHSSPASFETALAAGPPFEGAPATPASIVRETIDGGVRLSSGAIAFEVCLLGGGVMSLLVRGADRGQLGTVALDEVSAVARGAPVHLFVDARDATDIAEHVMEGWMAWLAAHRARFKRVHMLVPSRVLQLNLEIAREIAGLSDLIRVQTDAPAFESARARAARGGR